MAYDVNTDYSALRKKLQAQYDSTTDETQKAELKKQIDSADASRVEKIAGNLSAYGKYADDSTLSKVFNKQASDAITPTYTQAYDDLNKQYASTKSNLSNALLSRGWANSSYATDKALSVENAQADDINALETAKANAISAKASSLSDAYYTKQANDLANAKAEYAQYGTAPYSDNYMKEILNIQNDGDTSNDWKIPILYSARKDKTDKLEAAKATQKQQDFENSITNQKLAIEKQNADSTAYSAHKTSSGSGSGSSTAGYLSKSDAYVIANNILKSGSYSASSIQSAINYIANNIPSENVQSYLQALGISADAVQAYLDSQSGKSNPVSTTQNSSNPTLSANIAGRKYGNQGIPTN